MIFPERNRVVYEVNVLEEVKSQICFPPILKIDSSPPVELQESLRAEFPFFDTTMSMKIPMGIPQPVFNLVEGHGGGKKAYQFTTENKLSVLALSKDEISLTSRDYDRWETFRTRIVNSLKLTSDVYSPSFFTHTCLRYKNAIRRSQVGLEGVDWAELVEPWVGGIFSQLGVANKNDAYLSRCKFRVEESDNWIEAVFALATHQPTQEQAFVIETHVFNDSKKEVKNVVDQLDSLHRLAGNFFRWCITKKLHGAMRPKPV